MSELDDPAVPSLSAAPSGSRHVAVIGLFHEGASYTVSRAGGARSWLLTWTISGSGRLAHDSVAVPARPGDLVVLGPDVAQRYGTDGTSWAFWWAHFQPRPAWLATIAPWQAGPALYRTSAATKEDRTRIDGAFARALGDVVGTGPPSAPPGASPAGDELVQVSPAGTTDLVLNAIEEVLLVAARATRSAAGTNRGDGVTAALRAIAGNPARPFSVASLAAIAAMSPSHFAHQLKRRTGRTPMEVVRNERLDLARALLRTTSLPVGQVARAVGFDDPYYFTRVFTRHAGVPPSAYARSVLDL